MQYEISKYMRSEMRNNCQIRDLLQNLYKSYKYLNVYCLFSAWKSLYTDT